MPAIPSFGSYRSGGEVDPFTRRAKQRIARALQSRQTDLKHDHELKAEICNKMMARGQPPAAADLGVQKIGDIAKTRGIPWASDSLQKS